MRRGWGEDNVLEMQADWGLGSSWVAALKLFKSFLRNHTNSEKNFVLHSSLPKNQSFLDSKILDEGGEILDGTLPRILHATIFLVIRESRIGGVTLRVNRTSHQHNPLGKLPLARPHSEPSSSKQTKGRAAG